MSLDIKDLIATREALKRHGKALDRAWRMNKKAYCSKFRCRGQRMDWYVLGNGHVTERRALRQVADGHHSDNGEPIFPGGMDDVLLQFGAKPCTEEEAKVAYGRTAGILPKLLPNTSTGRILGPDGNPIR